jgi:hypothetical protein
MTTLDAAPTPAPLMAAKVGRRLYPLVTRDDVVDARYAIYKSGKKDAPVWECERTPKGLRTVRKTGINLSIED